jgi:hypothetical protein
MVSRRESKAEVETTRRRPATTPEARENQLVAAAVDLAEQQIINGTASAQVLTHYLKLGSTREKLEQARIAHENELLRVKVEALESQKRVEELYKDALDAMRAYSGHEVVEVPDEYDDD